MKTSKGNKLSLVGKRMDQGFTLIELLIVVIILGILGAIALPNLLAQASKGRQAEAKNNLGALNRAQRAYRLEELVFAQTIQQLPVKVSWQYYAFNLDSISQRYVIYSAKALPEYEDDILDYQAGVSQDKSGNITSLICEEKSLNSYNNFIPLFVVTTTTFPLFTVTLSCDPNTSRLVK